jgi:kynurenine 3-monooxygenase
MANVVVAGGGLAGLALGTLLAKSGFAVTVVEAREKAAHDVTGASRSINLALSARGLRTIDALGLTDEVMRGAVPLYGRHVHLPGGSEEFHPYDLVGNDAIHSVRRHDLWQVLCRAAESGGVDVRFGTRCADVDRAARTIAVRDRAGRTSRLPYAALVGADGAHSAVRRVLVAAGAAVEATRSMRHGYLELAMPAATAGRLDGHALHVWPRGDRMLIGLPNAGGGFTATLFVPLDGDGARRGRDTLHASFQREFRDAVPLIPDLHEALLDNPLCPLVATTCRPWSSGEVLLVGDAAHTMAPFYGQGMNCALEDCLVLAQSAERGLGDWARVVADFERRRRPDADAIVALSEANYDEMSRGVTAPDFKLRRAIERELQIRFPAFVPLYAMIAFSTVPYAEAVRRAAEQDAVVDRLAHEFGRTAGLDLESDWLNDALRRTAPRAPAYDLARR